MALLRVLVVALLIAAACAAENPITGKWSCTNVSVTGAESAWTLLVREEGTKLAGSLRDGEADLPLSEIKLDSGTLTFRFYVNRKPYTFEGRVEGSRLDGKYSGEEASGKLRCARPAS